MFINQMNPLKPLVWSFILFITPITYANEQAIFAGGCFWSIQHDFKSLKGIISSEVGYTGGTLPNPSYEQVSSGQTGHLEAIKITYDPKRISYQNLLDYYWHHIDPTNPNGQFCDSGSEYKTAIFYTNPLQHQMAQESVQVLHKTAGLKQIYTKIRPAQVFYPAETYHQHYADKNATAYYEYRSACKRDAILNSLWSHH